MKLNLLTIIACLGLTVAQVSDVPSNDESGEPGEGGAGANTDVSIFAGKYEFVYYSNMSGKTDTALVPCGESSTFTLTFPDDPASGNIEHDFSNMPDQKDPLYHSKLSSWAVMDLAKNSFYSLKMSVYINDIDQKSVCWGIYKSNKDIIVNINPTNMSQCPTEQFPPKTVCTQKRASLIGTCVSGVCNGEPSKFKDEEKDQSGALQFTHTYPMISLLGLALFYL